MPSSVVVGGPDELQSELTAYMYAPDDGGEGIQYHFMPHVGFVEPGTTVRWVHAGNGNVLHSVTSFHDEILEPMLVPQGSAPFNSGAFAKKKDPFEHTFETTGVFMYYCMPHKNFGMAGVIVVGDVGPDDPGWSPAMTADLSAEPYDVLNPETQSKIQELRHIVESGGHGGGGHDGGQTGEDSGGNQTGERTGGNRTTDGTNETQTGGASNASSVGSYRGDHAP